MANKLNMVCLVVLFGFGALFMSSVAQTIHTVGNSTGWRIPPGGAATYATWASQQTFGVGDILVFNYVGGTHDVTEVTKSAFDACTASNPISSVTTAPANVSLSSAGDHYFICTFSGHCNAGQKLSVTVSDTATSPPSTTATSSPPPPSSASSFLAISIPSIVFSSAIAFVFPLVSAITCV